MKRSNLSKFALIGAFTLSLAVLPTTLFASAQTSSSTAPSTTTSTTADQTSRSQENNHDFNWGWLGLLGLTGLLGLRKREVSNAYRDPADHNVRS